MSDSNEWNKDRNKIKIKLKKISIAFYFKDVDDYFFRRFRVDGISGVCRAIRRPFFDFFPAPKA